MKKNLPYIVICLFVISTCYVFYLCQFELFKTIDNKLQDLKFNFRKGIKPSDDVVLIAIDDRSIDKIGRWPWKRDIIAKLLDKINEYGPKTIALDMVFSENTEESDDKLLGDVIEKGKNFVLGFFFRKELKKNEQESAINNLEAYSILDVEVIGDASKVPIKDFPTAETNIPVISKGAVAKGFFSVFPDSDGILRRVQLIAGFNGLVMPSLALSALSQYLNQDISVIIDKLGVYSLALGSKKIPVSTTGSLLVNYYGAKHTIKYISAIDILEGNVLNNALKDKLVFVGVTEKAVGDFLPTPVDPYFPGTEIHATIASNILQNFYLKKSTVVYLVEIASIIFIPILITVISKKAKNTFWAFIGFILLCVVYFVSNVILFSKYNLRVSVIYPTYEFILTFMLLEVYRNFIIEKHSRYLKKAFSSYISKELVDEVVKYPDKLNLGGEKKEITVLFLDIRGFTTISEKLSPEELVLLLNHFFGPVTDIILKNHGMLDKYIGDAIMALYNVPVSLTWHAQAAVKSALEIVKSLDELNRNFKKMGLPTISIGIGINTGLAVVGNFGTKTRFDYTAVGDTVNFASRLEGLNKYLKTTVLVSESTVRNLNKNEFLMRKIGKVVVKGKSEPVDIYELVTNLNISKQDIDIFERAIYYFENQNFKLAYELFRIFYNKYEDWISKFYLEKIDKLMSMNKDHISSEELIIKFDKK